MHICMFFGGADKPKAFRRRTLAEYRIRATRILLPRALFPEEDVDSIFVPAVG